MSETFPKTVETREYPDIYELYVRQGYSLYDVIVMPSAIDQVSPVPVVISKENPAIKYASPKDEMVANLAWQRVDAARAGFCSVAILDVPSKYAHAAMAYTPMNGSYPIENYRLLMVNNPRQNRAERTL